jgi:cell division protein ZapA
MSSSTESVRVIIYGDEYSIKGDANGDSIKQVAEFVDGKIWEVQKSIASRDRVKVAVLSAMNIAEELFSYKEKCQQYLNTCEELRKKAEDIGRKIDEKIKIEHY